MSRSKSFIFLIFTVWFTQGSFFVAQTSNSDYQRNIKLADSLYKLGHYREASSHYSKAFKFNNWKGVREHRVMAAKSWARSGEVDSAFYNLFNIAEKAYYADLEDLHSDLAFTDLKQDSRWSALLKIVEKNYNKQQEMDAVKDHLVRMLEEDQNVRKELGHIISAKGLDSKEYDEVAKKTKNVDSLNSAQLKVILEKYGWLGPNEVGKIGNIALTVLLSHSPIDVKTHYLPMVEKAFLEKKIDSKGYVLIKDKVLLNQKGYQIYGSQVNIGKDGRHAVAPIFDKENVNERRSKVGLEPLEDYLKGFGITEY